MQSEKIDKIVDLAAALASRANEIDQVIVIYRTKNSLGSMDNGLCLDESLWLVEGFKMWLLLGAMDMLPKRDYD